MNDLTPDKVDPCSIASVGKRLCERLGVNIVPLDLVMKEVESCLAAKRDSQT